MEQFFQAWMQAQRAGNKGTSAKDMLRWLGVVSLLASACFWFPIQWELAAPTKPTEYAIAISFGTFLVLGPPVFTAFVIPWSPGARLLQRINAKLPGQMVVLACALYLTYYASQLLWAWWASRPLVAEANLAMQQTIVGIIATIIAPALLWAPVSSAEMEETLKQEQSVQRYKLQAQADIAYLQGIVLDAQRAAAHGLAHVAAEQGGAEVAWRMRYLAETIDQTIGEIAHTVREAGGTRAYFPNLLGNEDVIEVLDYVASLAEQTVSKPSPARPAATAPATAPVAHQDAERAGTQQVITGEGQAVMVKQLEWLNENLKRQAEERDARLRDIEAENQRLLAAQLGQNAAPQTSRASAGETSRETSRETAAPGSHRQSQAPALAAPPASAGASVAYDTARLALDGAWRRAELEQVLGIRETKANDFIRSWKDVQLVEELTEPKWHYRWTRALEVAE